MTDPDTELERFLQRLWDDHDAGRLRRLSDYLREFPEDEERVAREYFALLGRRDEDVDGIGHYRIIEEIGRGGQAIVYRARDKRLSREVALKVLRRPSVFDSKTARRFQREAEIVARLDHPGICPVYEAGWETATPFIAMQYLRGRTLGNLISDGRAGGGVWFSDDRDATGKESDGAAGDQTGSGPRTRTELHRMIFLVEEICRIVHFAHEQGVVHRDIKPSNVMITERDQPVVLDFGLARSEQGDETLTTRGGYLGTRAYMSPEQFLPRPVHADRRTDIWSLGVTLFECLTMRRPFSGATESALTLAIQGRPPPDIRKLNPGVSRDLKTVVETALEKDRESRYQTAEDLAEDLRRVRCFEPIRARPAGPVLRTRRWIRRNRTLTVGTSVVFLTLAVALAVSLAALREARLAQERRARLADLRRVVDLDVWADRLWPLRPDVADGPWGLDAWLREARRVAARLPDHEAALRDMPDTGGSVGPAPGTVIERWNPDASDTLRRLRQRRAALAGTDSGGEDLRRVDELIAEAERALPAGDAWLHDASDEGWVRRNRRAIQDALASLPGLIESMDRRRERIDEIARRHEVAGPAWAAAARRIADDEVYADVEIPPVIGLEPLGPDPDSGLEEFALLGTGTVPKRDAERSLVTGDATAIVLVLVPGATYRVGQLGQETGPDGNRLAPFLIGKHEVTRGQWRSLMGDPGTEIRIVIDMDEPLGDDHPVDGKSWHECVEFCRRAGVGLPTEAQWEYASRAGSDTPWLYGHSARSYEGRENLADASLRTRHPEVVTEGAPWNDSYVALAPVGSFPANDFGLHDMGGNLSEWCRDRYDAELPDGGGSDGDGLHLLSTGSARVIRGGNWLFPPRVCGSTRRQGGIMPATRTAHLGFRVAMKL